MRRTKTQDVAYTRLAGIAGVVGIAAAALSVVGLFTSGAAAFFQAYLLGFVFWLSLSLGLLALLLTHFLMRTHWGLTIRRVAEAGAGSLWVMAILFIPIVLGMTYLFPWARPAEVQASAVLQAKTFYLNVPFFLVRAVAYFAIWILLAVTANRLSSRLNFAEGDAQEVVRGRLQGLGAFGLILYILTMTFASVDWMMSIQPFWSSTIFGMIIIIGQVLTALAFTLVMLNLLPGQSLGSKWNYLTTPVPFQDLGALLFAFIVGWAYLAYFQLLIIWAGNLPREVTWYQARTAGGWNIVAILVALFQFVLPFLALLSIRARHNLRVLGGLGLMLVVTFFVNLFWHIKPAFSPGVLAISWLDIVVPVAIGGIWLAVFLFHLSRRPALRAEEQKVLRLKAEDATKRVAAH